jgi:hypothetical protein
MLSRGTVFVSAVLAAAIVAGLEISAPRAETPSAAAQVAHRFPLPNEMFTPVPISSFVANKFTAAQKTAAQRPHRSPASEFCAMTPRGWPYVSHECRVAAGGAVVPTLMQS